MHVLKEHNQLVGVPFKVSYNKTNFNFSLNNTIKNEVYKCFNHRLLLYAINCISQLASYKKDSTIVPVKSTAIKQKITLPRETTKYHNCQGL